tara:strand:+ start:110 stop:484 length:375 start_codon:yes stop_codon:yes gene_type:complete
MTIELRERISLSSAKGRRFEGWRAGRITSSSKLLLFDGAYCVIGIEHGYEAGDAEIAEPTCSTDDVFDAFAADTLIEALITTAAAVEQRAEAKRRRAAELREKFERKQYEKLKAKFGGVINREE